MFAVNKMLKNHSINKFIILFFIALFCLSAQAQTGEIKCTLNITDRTLDVKIEVPPGKSDKTSFSLSDWAGQQNFAENVYRVAARDKNGNALTVEKTAARTWTIGNAKKAFEISYTVISQKDSFMGNNVRNHFHPTIFKDYAFLWGMSFLLFPEAKELASMPVRLQLNPNEYTNFYTNFEGRANSFDDLSDLFV